jgi:hypothetical protein
VISKRRDGLTKACAGGKPTQIFGCNEIDREIIGLKKNLEGPIEFKLIFARDNIRFRRFSTTNQIHYCLDFSRICGKSVERCAVPEFKNS